MGFQFVDGKIVNIPDGMSSAANFSADPSLQPGSFMSSLTGYGGGDMSTPASYAAANGMANSYAAPVASGFGMPDWLSSMLPKDWSLSQTRDAQGNMSGGQWGDIAKLGMGLGSLYMGMKQYGLAKDQLSFQKDSFAKNFNAQAKLTNSHLADRQAARVASNAGAYQSVGDYMNKYGVA